MPGQRRSALSDVPCGYWIVSTRRSGRRMERDEVDEVSGKAEEVILCKRLGCRRKCRLDDKMPVLR